MLVAKAIDRWYETIYFHAIICQLQLLHGTKNGKMRNACDVLFAGSSVGVILPESLCDSERQHFEMLLESLTGLLHRQVSEWFLLLRHSFSLKCLRESHVFFSNVLLNYSVWLSLTDRLCWLLDVCVYVLVGCSWYIGSGRCWCVGGFAAGWGENKSENSWNSDYWQVFRCFSVAVQCMLSGFCKQQNIIT